MAKVDFKNAKALEKIFITEAKKKLPRLIKNEVINSIESGVSPVQGKGRFKRYSKSYRDVIRDKAAYRTINGRVIRFNANKRNKQKIKDLNQDFRDSQRPAKKISPVTMRVTGKMLSSFFVRKIVRGFAFGFRSKLAVYHNNGDGNLPARRLLPNKTGERFTSNITERINQTLRDVLKNITK
jgi:hypothetical protein